MSTTLITADELFQRVDHVVPAVEWATMADDVNAIMRLKKERNAVILAHNHPSGVAEPSQADELITHRLKDALAIVDIRVLDHLIVAGAQVVSMAERGVL